MTSATEHDASAAAGSPDSPRALENALERALAEVGITCRVEAQGRLALLLAPEDSLARLVNDAARHRTVDLARAIGFSHVAIELRAARNEHGSAGEASVRDAPLPRD